MAVVLGRMTTFLGHGGLVGFVWNSKTPSSGTVGRLQSVEGGCPAIEVSR